MSSFIPDEIITRVREATDIVGVVSQYVSLRKSGRNYLGLCPFHPEKTPSFTVSSEKQIFYCFGCGEGGNVFNFLMKMEGKAFPESVRELAGRAGITIPGQEDGRSARNAEQRQSIFEVNEMAARYYHKVLITPPHGEKGQDYLSGREIGGEMIEKHRIGFAPGSGSSLRDALEKRGYKEDLLLSAGLIVKRDAGGTLDRFRNRVIFPITDLGGHVVAFGGRTVENSPDTPKYLNSPDTPVYNKGGALFGINRARALLKKPGQELLLVEGYLDLVMLDQAGFECCVATCGTALTEHQVEMIRRLTDRLILCFDGDEAGRKAVLRAAEILLPSSMIVRVISLPPEDDPDSFIKRYGVEAFEARKKAALPLMDFIISHFCSGDLATIQDRGAAFEAVAPYLARLGSEIQLKLHVNHLSDRLGIDEMLAASRVRELRKERGDGAKPGAIKTGPSEGGKLQNAELLLLFVALTRPSLLSEIDTGEISSKMVESEVAELFQTAVAAAREGKGLSLASVLDVVNSPRIRTAMAALEFDGKLLDGQAGRKTVEDCIAKIRREWIQASIKLLDGEIHSAQESGEEERLRELLSRKMKLARELKETVVDPKSSPV